MDDDIVLSVERATLLGTTALRSVGYTGEEASVITAHLVDAALCGYRFAGLPRILTINEDSRTHQPRSPIKIVYETGVSAMIDGGNHIGYYAIDHATNIAIEKAKAHGISVTGIHNTYLSGRNSYYLERIARAGLVGMHVSSSAPIVIPFGGAEPAFGTNPIAFGYPNEPNPFIVDIGTASMMRGEVILRSRTGAALPDETALDADGNPTNDPVEALKGGILAFGGHRGSALSFGIQAMGVLAGAMRTRGRAQDFGFMFVVFDPEILMPRAEFQAGLQELIENVRRITPRDPEHPIRIPSERAFAERDRRRIDGIPLARPVHQKLLELSGLR